MSRKKRNHKKGFTVAEMLVAIVIVAILSAVTVPSVFGFVSLGQQNGRMNIARSLYLTAQEQLTQKKVSKALASFSAPFIDDITGQPNGLAKVYEQNVSASETEISENGDYLRFIKKPATSTLNPDDPVVALLSTVVQNKNILNGAICIEYNIQTGVVLSVFYSDTIADFTYVNIPENDPEAIISGARPYQNAAERKQGYYGANGSGNRDLLHARDIISLHDGATEPLKEDVKQYKNILYAELLVSKDAAAYQMQLFSADRTSSLIADIDLDFSKLSPSLDTLEKAQPFITQGKPFVYISKYPPSEPIMDGDRNITDQYMRIIWVLDYVQGDMLLDKNQAFSIGNAYENTDGTPLAPQDIRVAIKLETAPVYTQYSNVANSHFASETIGTDKLYSLSSARHLNNIRYLPAAKYRQIETIDLLNTKDSSVSNFQPIENFAGEYSVKPTPNSNIYVQNLTVETRNLPTMLPNVGLFANVKRGGKITGLSLQNAKVSSRDVGNVGAIVGLLESGASLQRSRVLANIMVNCSPQIATPGALNIGGLVGAIETGAKIDQSYNGGFYNALSTDGTMSNNGIGSVRVTGRVSDKVTLCIGGIAGKNEGEIKNVYNNARVNVDDIDVGKRNTEEAYLSMLKVKDASFTILAAKEPHLGGIAGENALQGSVSLAYATNYVASYKGGKSGGIVGYQNPAYPNNVSKSFYISNGSFDNEFILKQELADRVPFTSLYFVKSNSPYTPGKNGKGDYPFPVLRNAPHMSGFEDIKETVNAKAEMGYFELYQDGTGAYFTNEDTLNADKNIRPAVAEGYYLEYEQRGAEQLKIAVRLGDKVLKSNTWVWNDGIRNSKPITLTKADGKKYNRLFLNTSVLEAAANGGEALSIEVLVGNEDIIDSEIGKMYFNPLFAAVPKCAATRPAAVSSVTVRSPRHLHNVEKLPQASVRQTLNIDFATYRSEVQTLPFTAPTHASADESANGYVHFNCSVVNTRFSGSYDGGGYYIRNADIDTDRAGGTTGDQNSTGIFSAVSGYLHNIALVDGLLAGKATNLGGIAGLIEGSGKVSECQISYVSINGTSIFGTQSVGGLAGRNVGKVDNIYVSDARKNNTTGLFLSPISANGFGTKYLGGIVGNQQGSLNNAYVTAMGPMSKGFSGKSYPKPIVGIGAIGENGKTTNVYYMSSQGFNYSNDVKADSDKENGNKNATSVSYNDADTWHPEVMFKDNAAWTLATQESTYFTQEQAGVAYPYPAIKGMAHCKDWPFLVTTLRYFEQYSDSSFGYFYYPKLGSVAVDTLRTDAGVTVVDEGYIIDLVSGGQYQFVVGTKADGTEKWYTLVADVMDGKMVLKIPMSNLDNVFPAKNISASGSQQSGIMPVRVQARATYNNAPDVLYGSGADAYFIPMFPKQIYLAAENEKVDQYQSDFEIRSPRQMKNITGHVNDSNNRTINEPRVSFTQTIDINFAGVSTAANSIVKNLNTKYSATLKPDATDPITDRKLSYKISNLVLKVPNVDEPKNGYRSNAAGVFGTISAVGSVSDVEFVDPQFRYDGNGTGGGIVANVSYGTIDNVKVHNTKSAQLFADKNGTANLQFCASRAYNGKPSKFARYSHAHGGIAGAVLGRNAKITNCTVGTNSNNISEIFDNKTQITCFSDARVAKQLNIEESFILMGGIVGNVSDYAKVVSCSNTASIVPNTSKMKEGAESSHQVGGIAGRLGNADASYLKNPKAGNAPEDLSSGYIVGCYNAGTVKSDFGYIGGIAARTAAKSKQDQSKIISCYNTGRINIEYNGQGALIQSPYYGKSTSLRIGGITGEVDSTLFQNCYNIGYISGSFNVNDGASAAGAIFGLPTYGDTTIENCYSLSADQFRPKTIVGARLYQKATVNGLTDSNFYSKFGAFWEPRASLRYNESLTSNTYQKEPYPGLENSWVSGKSKDYPVFQKAGADSGFYIYPNLSAFEYEGVTYHNPHITPWEYVDAKFDANLKYYEKYSEKQQDGTDKSTYGFWYKDISGTIKNTLEDKIAVEDGYYIGVGIAGDFTVEINDQTFNVESVQGAFDIEDNAGIILTDEMLNKCNPLGYNKIRLYTNLKEIGDGALQIAEDNKLNRLIGTTTIKGQNSGTDMYFDKNFPREIQLAEAAVDKATLKKAGEPYAVRSVRHLTSIGAMNGAIPTSLTIGRTFIQENDLDPTLYTSAVPGLTNGVFANSAIPGTFEGVYDGSGKTISNMNISGKDALVTGETVQNIGMFANNKGVIQNIIFKAPILDCKNLAVNMGVVAAQNESTVQNIAVYDPKLSTQGIASVQNIGTIVGISQNNGQDDSAISDINIVSTAPTIIATAVPSGTVNMGGVVGHLSGDSGNVNSIISQVIYLADAPLYNGVSSPCAATIGADALFSEIYYLQGVGVNENAAAILGTIGQGTKAFALYPFIRTDEWPLWNRDTVNYPYPLLDTAQQPNTYPTVASFEKILTAKLTLNTTINPDEYVKLELDITNGEVAIELPMIVKDATLTVPIRSDISSADTWMKITKTPQGGTAVDLSHALSADEIAAMQSADGLQYVIELANDGIVVDGGAPFSLDIGLYTNMAEAPDPVLPPNAKASIKVITTVSTVQPILKNEALKPPESKPKPSGSDTTPSESEAKPPDSDVKPPDSESKPPESEPKPPESEPKPPESKPKPSESDVKPPESKPKPSESDVKPPDSGVNSPANGANLPSDNKNPLNGNVTSSQVKSNGFVLPKNITATFAYITSAPLCKEKSFCNSSVAFVSLAQSTPMSYKVPHRPEPLTQHRQDVEVNVHVA